MKGSLPALTTLTFAAAGLVAAPALAADAGRPLAAAAAPKPVPVPTPPVPDLAGAPRWSVVAPAGKLRLTVALSDRAPVGAPKIKPGRLYFKVDDGSDAAAGLVLPWSPLGVSRADERFVDSLTFVEARQREVRDVYDLPRGKRRHIDTRGRESTLVFVNANRARLELTVRAYDDGVAFRYGFPERKRGPFIVTGEETGFEIPEAALGTLLPHDDPSQWTPAYEEVWRTGVAVGTASPHPAGWAFPALFQTASHAVLITETGLDRTFAGSRLAQPQGRLYRVRLPDGGEGEGYGSVFPESSLPWTLPWRLLIVGSTLAPVVESTLVTTLASPAAKRDTSWVRPGRASWSWWSDNGSPREYQRMLPFIDLAAQLGWEYFLVDANWETMSGGTLADIVAYARSKNVKVLAWYNSGGPNNRVSEGPRDRMFIRDVRRAEMKRIASLGVVGIKVDFFQSDKQATIAQYLDIAADAAEFKLMVNFHGCTIPRGWERTYPNLIGHEAVRGAEQYLFSNFAAVAPAHNTALVFARNVIGPMDYTPFALTRTKLPHVTTSAHELALSVLFENGIQHFADAASVYDALPEAVKGFLKALPAAWDDTRYIAGAPGTHAVLGRRAGQAWYIAGINGERAAKSVPLPLAFLGGGSSAWTATTITDAADGTSFVTQTSAVKATDAPTLPLRGYGGFVMRLVPAQ